MTTRHQHMNPQGIVEAGERIYKEKYQSEYEKKHFGRFAAIDVNTEKIYVSDVPEKALKDARDDDSEGVFHLIRIGSTGAFRVSYSTNNAHRN